MLQSKRWKKISFFGLLSAICFAFLSLAALQERNLDVPYVPTPEEVVEAMLDMAEVSKDDVLYDLGCGDGRIVITAAKMYGSRGIGIDIDPQRIKECHENARKAGVESRVQFFQADLFETDFSKASVVTLYLLTEINRRLRPKFLEELNPGTRIVSHDFNMGMWRADKDILIEDEWEVHSVYLWIVPANVTGTWTWSMPTGSGNKNFTLNLEQSFQYLNGEAFENKVSLPVTIFGGQIIGNTLSFTVERKQGRSSERLIFEGSVLGHSIVGTVKTEGHESTRRWEAKRDPSTRLPLDSPVKDFYTLNQ
jgi:SAM-dependent methyltransferase